MQHTANSCAVTRLPGGIDAHHQADDDAVVRLGAY